LLLVGNHARKYQHGLRSQTNPFAIAAFDIQGQITKSKGQMRSYFSFFQNDQLLISFQIQMKNA